MDVDYETSELPFGTCNGCIHYNGCLDLHEFHCPCNAWTIALNR